MNDVTVSMKMSPKATGALYLKSIRQGERIAELENCLRQYLDATQPIYTNSGELSVVEYKASCLLEQSE